MKKVIIKCKMHDMHEFKEKLLDIDMHFSNEYWQHDRIFVPRGYKRDMNLPRLIMRTEMRDVKKPAKYSIVLKRHIEDSGVDIMNVTPVSEYSEMVGIIQQLGFKQQTEISRRRQELDMGEGTMLFIDKLENSQDYYAKIETELGEDDTVADVQLDLSKTMAVLGENDIVDVPYSEM